MTPTSQTPRHIIHAPFPLKKLGNSEDGRSIYVADKVGATLQTLQSAAEKPGAQAFHAQTVLRAVDTLRSAPACGYVYLKNNDLTKRSLIHSGFEIYYEICRTGMAQTDILITDLRLTKKEAARTIRAGLWQASYVINSRANFGNWTVTNCNPEITAQSKQKLIKVGINGHCGTIDHAANLLPPHICKGEPAALTVLKQEGYQLFFIPPAKDKIKLGWRTLQQQSQIWKDSNQIRAAKILATHMLEAHRRELHIEWTSHGSGSFTLTEAMKLLSKYRDNQGQPLDLKRRQSIFLSNHTTGHAPTDVLRRQLNMDVSANKWHNHNPINLIQQFGGQRLGGDSIACALNELVFHTPTNQTAAGLTKVIGETWTRCNNAATLGAAYGAIALTAGPNASQAIAIAHIIAANIPSLNQDYYIRATQPFEKLAQKIQNRFGHS
jgi:hypothetical protein